MILLGVSFLAVALDQLTKYLILQRFQLNESIPVIPGVFNLTYIQNPGAAFGFMADMPGVLRIPFFVAITIAAGFMIYAYQRLMPPEKTFARGCLGLIWGGAVGNFIDRMIYGKVVDFIEVGYKDFIWPVFNVADSCITVGIILLAINYLTEKPEKQP